MRVVVAGSSGLLGTALRVQLARDGHEVVRLIRGQSSTPTESSWDPAAGSVDQAVVDAADVVINLAGAPIAHWPWTAAYKRQLLESRLATTGTLARAVARTPRPPVLLNGSGVNYYGDDRGAEDLDEDSGKGVGFLADVSEQWEAATAAAAAAGARVCMLRSGVVIDRTAIAFRLMRLPFWFGLGGRLGSGRQFMPVVSLADWVAAVLRLATTDGMSGPYNIACMNPPTNAEFAKAVGAQMHRPAVVPVPAPPMRWVLGGLATQGLSSLRVHPRRLLDAGFQFAHPDVRSVVAAALGDD